MRVTWKGSQVITCRASLNSASVTARCFCRASLLACSCSCCCACFAPSASLASTSRLTWFSYHATLHSKLLCRGKHFKRFMHHRSAVASCILVLNLLFHQFLTEGCTSHLLYQDLLQESAFPMQPENMYVGATLPIATLDIAILQQRTTQYNCEQENGLGPCSGHTKA